MMTLDELQRHLDALNADLRGAVAAFSAERPADADDPYALLEWLRDRGDLTTAQMLAIHAREPLATTELASSADLVPLGQLGAGGVGDVYIARDPRLNRKVAVKAMRRPDPRKHQKRMRRFVNEAQITAQLEHPGIVPVYDLRIEDDGTLAYSMKLVHGQTLSEVVAADRATCEAEGRRFERRALPRRLEHFVKICDAIGSAHDRRVIHRDLKPANVMVGPFHEVYVMDWGLAKVLSSEGPASSMPPSGSTSGASATPGGGSTPPPSALAGPRVPKIGGDDDFDPHALTKPGQLIGTPRYMSAEQARGKVKLLDARSDVASLGAILYELVTLRTARDTDDFGELLKMATEGRLGPLEHAVAGIVAPAELCAVAMKAVHREPSERYPSAEELGEDVRRFLRGERVHAVPDDPAARRRRWIARNGETLFKLLVAALAALILALVVIVALLAR